MAKSKAVKKKVIRGVKPRKKLTVELRPPAPVVLWKPWTWLNWLNT
jgi:hypothetical protein